MTHINVSEVLSSLSLAKEAYEALPDLRRQIDDLQAALASKDRLLSQTQSTLEETIAGKANVEAKLKEVESDRDDYFLRHEEAQEKLDKMAQLIGIKPSPTVNQAEPVSQSATTPTAQTAQATIGAVSADTAKSSSTEPGQSAPLPTQAPASTTTGTTEPIGVTEPVLNPTQEWGHSVSHPTSASSEAAPVQTSTAGSTAAYSNTQSDHGDESNVVDKPYLGHPSWEKPHDMAWNEWESKGGTVPGWMKHNG